MTARGAIAASPVWLKLLLLASLAVNLALIGALAGAVFGAAAGEDDRADRRLPFLLRILPEEKHDEARALLAAEPAVRPEGEAVRAEAVAAIRADPFDPERLTAVFARWNEQTVERRSRTQAQIVEIASRMTPEERERMAVRLEGMIERWRARRAARREAAGVE